LQRVRTIRVAYGQVVLRARVSTSGRHCIEIRRFVLIWSNAPALCVAGCQPALRCGITQIGSLAKKMRSYGCIPVHTFTSQER
jgi:hypothetical protein